MKKSMKLINKLYSIFFLIFVIIIWQIAANNDIINTFHFSSPKEIFKDLLVLFKSGQVWPHIAATFGVSLAGLLLGTLSGIALAFLFANFNILNKIFDPILVGLYGLPKLALGPLFIIWFGIGIKAKIVMSTIMVFFQVFFNSYAGLKNIDKELITTLKIFGANKIDILKKVALPSCVPWIAASLRTGAGAAVMGTIVGEYLGSNKGLGWMVQNAGGVYNITRVLSCIFILVIFMSIIDFILKKMEKSILRWRP